MYRDPTVSFFQRYGEVNLISGSGTNSHAPAVSKRVDHPVAEDVTYTKYHVMLVRFGYGLEGMLRRIHDFWCSGMKQCCRHMTGIQTRRPARGQGAPQPRARGLRVPDAI